MPTDLTESLRKQIDSHGYAFQVSLAAKLRQASLDRRIKFRVEAQEVAVEAGDKPAHVDFVMRDFAESCWLVCECKRSDPAISDWCFATMPLVERLGPTDVIGEVVRLFPNYGEIRTRGIPVATHPAQYDFGFELRSRRAGEGGPGRGALADALAQVVRQLNGYVRLLAQNHALVTNRGVVSVLPVLFTTAKLWTTSDDLSAASLEDGRLAGEPAELQEKEWLCYRFRQSTALRHEHGQGGSAERLSDILARDSIRTVFVVRAEAYESFFQWLQSALSISWPDRA